MSRLGNLAAKKVGPNVLLKVMAGDEITTTALYYYKNPVSPGRGTTLLNDVLSSLVQAITGSPSTPALTKDAIGNISTNLGGYYPFTHAIAPDADNDAGNAPKAYLNVLFFNERMEFVKEGSAAVRVEHEGNNTLPLLQHIRAPKNGYCYVYLSNESDEAVYFDNFQVQHERGRIIEEDHYYAYGLKIAPLSSQKAGDVHEGTLDNKHLYNDKELIDDADLGWYDYGFRNYDPQIGRFPQLDPLTFEYPFLTPYQYASCDPATNIDVDGLEGIPAGFGNTYFGPLAQAIHQYAKEVMPEVVVTTTRHIIHTIDLSLAVTATVGATERIIAQGAEQYADDVIAQALRREAISSLAQFSLRGGLTTFFVLLPLRAGPDLPEEANGDETWWRKKADQAHYEELRTHAAAVSDEYLAEVKKRLDNGTATFNDQAYKDEIERRGIGKKDQQQDEGNYKLVKGNKSANDLAEELGYRDAHELKRVHVGKGNEAKFDIYRDSKSDKARLYNKDKTVGVDVYPNH